MQSRVCSIKLQCMDGCVNKDKYRYQFIDYDFNIEDFRKNSDVIKERQADIARR